MTDPEDWDETPGSTLDPFPSVRGSSRLLGVNTEGRPIYYDEEAHARRDASDEDDEGASDDWHDERSMDDSSSVGDLLDDVERNVGWDELTDYARDHLPGVEDADSDSDSKSDSDSDPKSDSDSDPVTTEIDTTAAETDVTTADSNATTDDSDPIISGSDTDATDGSADDSTDASDRN